MVTNFPTDKVNSEKEFSQPIPNFFFGPENEIKSDDSKASCSSLTHLFPMHPFSTPWKHQTIVWFSDVFRGLRKGCIGTKWVNSENNSYSLRNEPTLRLPLANIGHTLTQTLCCSKYVLCGICCYRKRVKPSVFSEQTSIDCSCTICQ